MKINKQPLVYFLSVVLFIGSCSVSKNTVQQQKQESAVGKADEVLPLDPNVKTGKLANGFTYFIRRNTEPKERAQLYLAVKAGSILENDDQLGLAHFMEHMSFNGTKNYPKNALVDYLQKAGVRFGADLNAYTSFDETVYMLPIPTDDSIVFNNGMQIMREWAQNATLDIEEINKERGVVLEEKRSGKGAQERMQNKYLPIIFNSSRYSNRLPIGTEEVLKNFSRETLLQFYQDWYRPDLQALIVVGDIDVDRVEQMIREKFSDLKNPEKPRERTEYHIPLINKNQFIAVTDKEFPVTVVQVMIKHPEKEVKTTADLRDNMIRSLYNQMLSSRFSELSKQANPPFIQGGSNISGFLAGLDVASSFVVAKPGEIEKGFKAVWLETERVKRFGFTDTELSRAKQSFMTAIESAFKERDKTPSESFVQEYLQYFLNEEASPGIEYEYAFYQKNMEGIKVGEVNELSKKYLTEVNRDVVIMAPEKEAANLPDEGTMNKWMQDVQSQEIEAYVDDVTDKPLIETKPVAGKVTSEKKIEELGVTELTLSNGVKVVLKPTDFKNDEISFNAFSPGGTSLYGDEDYQSAAYASAIISRSGVGAFNSIQLPKMLAGKNAYVSPYISERTEGISGSTTPKDLETALQLAYLYFTQPRKDTAIFQSMITQQRGALANRSSDPNAVFSDTVSAVLGNYNIRRTGPTIEKLDQIDLEKAYSIYKERFADASDFTFTFVGNFKVEELKPLLEQYVASLPATGRKETDRDLGIIPPKGKLVKRVYKGQEEKSTTRIVFTGDYTYSEDNNNQLNALAEVLQIKLIERLREEESGVYSTAVRASYAKFPRNRFSITIAFGSGPENVEKLIAATFDEINKIRQKGAAQVDVEKFMAEERRTTQLQLKENSFWVGYLAGQYQNQEDPKHVLTYLEDLKKVTPESLKVAANRYLSGENVIQLILMPENSNK